MLVDGKPHNITIDVISAEADHSINQNWFVSGNLQVVTDPSGKPTRGSIDVFNASPFPVTSTTGSVGSNGDVIVTVSATHNIHIESTIISGSGKTTHVVWSQSLGFSNTQFFLDDLLIQVGERHICSRSVPNTIPIQNVAQTSTCTASSTHNGVAAVTDDYSFPFNINITTLTPDGSTCAFTFLAMFCFTSH